MTHVDDYRDPRDDWEPDPTDYLEQQAREEQQEHEDQVHGGARCDCPPPRAPAAWRRLAAAVTWRARHLFRPGARIGSVRLGQFEVTFRRRPAVPPQCCGGRGWNYTKGTTDPAPLPPPGYDGPSLCPCGAAVDQLADYRERMRAWDRENRNKPPF